MIKKLFIPLFLLLPLLSMNSAEPSQKPSTESSPTFSKETKQDKGPDLSNVKPEAPLPKPDGDTYLPQNDGYKAQFMKTIAGVLIAIVLAILGILLFRRFSGGRPLQMNSRKHIKVIERRPLSPNTYLYYIQVGNKQFVIAESKLEVRTIANLDWSETDPNTDA